MHVIFIFDRCFNKKLHVDVWLLRINHIHRWIWCSGETFLKRNCFHSTKIIRPCTSGAFRTSRAHRRFASRAWTTCATFRPSTPFWSQITTAFAPSPGFWKMENAKIGAARFTAQNPHWNLREFTSQNWGNIATWQKMSIKSKPSIHLGLIHTRPLMPCPVSLRNKSTHASTEFRIGSYTCDYRHFNPSFSLIS